MKKQHVLTVIIWLSFLLYVKAQDTVYVNGKQKIYKNGISADDYQSPLIKDDYLLEFSYGYPFVPMQEASFFGLDIFSETSNKRTISNTNHLCFRADYQLNNFYSVGLELTYANQQLEYIRKYYSPINPNAPSTDTTYQATVSKLRLLTKINYHFNISERFDAFGTAGFGYKQFNYSTRDTYLSSNDVINEILPLAVRFSIGGRFFINKDVAVHVEGGIGGPMMQIGITYKLHSSYYGK